MRHRIPRVRQRDLTDCGAACLASVAEHYGLRLPVSRIRQYASTDRKGTNVLGLVEAAAKLGFTAKAVKGGDASLTGLPLPAIAHVVLESGLHHYVVLYRATPERVVLMDPGDGEIHELATADFLAIWSGVLVLLVPGERFSAGDLRAPAVARFWSLVRPHRTVMAQALLGAAVYTLLGLATAVFVQKLVDHVLVDGNRQLLNLMGAVLLVLFSAQLYIGSTRDLYALRTGQKIDAALILGYYQHLLRLPQRFFDTMRVGEIISRVNDAVKIRLFINDVSLDLVVNLLVVLFSVGLMLLYSWKLALLVVVALPMYALLYAVANRLNRRTQRRVMESAAELESQLVESLNAVSTIKRFGLEGFADLRTETRFVGLLGSVYRSGINSIFASNASEFLSRLLTLAVLWVGAVFVMRQALTPGELMSFYALIAYLTGPVVGLIGANRTLQDALIAADRLFEIMDLERESEATGLQLTKARTGDIHFEQVCFRFGSREHVFDGLDLVIRARELTGIVGESGCGKSTLLSLLQHVYPVNAGRIRIGGYDVREMSSESLRRVVAVVPQEIHLFSGSVVENIAVGEFEPDLERVARVAGLVGISEFVERLPHGFLTLLGENGVTLSGGERQRIAIARALYRDPSILLLDEATSALDSRSERFVQRTIHALREEGCTVVVVAHRLTTVMGADRLVVLEGGRVVESGTHADLVRADGAYARLWWQQFPDGLPTVPHSSTPTAQAPARC